MLSTASQMRWSALVAPGVSTSAPGKVMEGRGELTDGHVRSTHVVVDTSDESDDVEVRVSLVLLRRDVACLAAASAPSPFLGQQTYELTVLEKLRHVVRPLGPQPVRSRETSVSTTDDERVDALLDEVERRLPPPFELPELCTPRRPDKGSSNTRESPHIVPSDLFSSTPHRRSASSASRACQHRAPAEIPTHTNNVAVLERLLPLSVLEQLSLSVRRDEAPAARGVGSWRATSDVNASGGGGGVSANEAFPAFADNVGLASSARGERKEVRC